MIRIDIWDLAKGNRELKIRLDYAMRTRLPQEDQWRANELTVYGSSSPYSTLDRQFSAQDDEDAPPGVVEVNYVHKNIKFLHAQMSANPPSAEARPATSDQQDRRRAIAADQLMQNAFRVHNLTEVGDVRNLDTLIYGNGWKKVVWNPNAGDILEQSDEGVTLEGQIEFTTPNIWNVYPDPDAESWSQCKWVFERILVPYADAIAMWPQYIDQFKESRIQNQENSTEESGSMIPRNQLDSVEIFEYWETGLPNNGYLGRYALCTRQGSILEAEYLNESPFAFTQPGKLSEIEEMELDEKAKEALLLRLPVKSRLPYTLLTEVDVPHSLWGKSTVEFVAPLQLHLNALDTMHLDNVATVGSIHIVLPENSEVADDSLSNSPHDIVKIGGGQTPYHISPPQMTPDHGKLRDTIKQAIDDMMGINEAMLGQQSREISGASMEYSVQQGNLIRRRLYNKYRNVTEMEYQDYLDLVRKHWDIERTIQVIGKEKTIEAVDYKGMDVDGGFDIFVEYGTSLSLDPQTRRQEMIGYYPILKEAGMSPKSFIQKMKLGEMDAIYDEFEVASNRQREIFEKMMLDPTIYIPPEEFQDHENYQLYAMRWRNSAEFLEVSPEAKYLILQHIRDRYAMMGQIQGQAMGAVPQQVGGGGQQPQAPQQAPNAQIPSASALPAIANA